MLVGPDWHRSRSVKLARDRRTCASVYIQLSRRSCGLGYKGRSEEPGQVPASRKVKHAVARLGARLADAEANPHSQPSRGGDHWPRTSSHAKSERPVHGESGSELQCLGGNSLTTAAVMARIPVAILGPGSG